jgi:hypothetical protein
MVSRVSGLVVSKLKKVSVHTFLSSTLHYVLVCMQAREYLIDYRGPGFLAVE